MEEQTNVHVDWKAIQGDQWGDKITLEMSNIKTLPELVFNAGFGDTDLLKYATIIISSLPLLIMYPFFQKYFDNGIMAGAVKG